MEGKATSEGSTEAGSSQQVEATPSRDWGAASAVVRAAMG